VEISLNPRKDKARTALETERIHKEGRQIPASRGVAVQRLGRSRVMAKERAPVMEQELALV
jgi:hypothetical protein